MARDMIGWSLERREAERALYAEVARLRKETNVTGVAKQLGLTMYRVYALLNWPPISEQEWQNRAQFSAKHKEWARAKERRRREAAKQLKLAEEDEKNGNALACLIEALIEMRPYLPEVDA